MIRRVQLAVAVVVMATMLSFPILDALTLRSVPAAAAQSVPPSILVIQTDDMRADDLLAMPKTRAWIQARGLSFDNYIAGGTPLCCPNRSSALTGQYPHNHGVLTNSGPNGGHGAFKRRGNENRTIAVALKAVGYRTAYIGKYLNQYPAAGGNRQVPPGWDQWHALLMNFSCDECGGGGDGYYYNYRLNQNRKIRAYSDKKQDYSTNVFTREAQKVIATTPSTTPLFLWVNPMAPHGPPVPGPGDKRRRVVRSYKSPAFNHVGLGKVRWIKRLPKMKRELKTYVNQRNVERRRTLLAVDDMVAKLVPAMPPGSWVFFLSDNGYMLGEFRIAIGKVVPYRSSVEVPLLVVGPGVAPGSSTPELASSIDLAPTWAAIAGATMPGTVDGIDLLPILTPGAPGVGPATPRDSVLLSWGGSSVASAEADLDGDVLPASLSTGEPSPVAPPTTARDNTEAERQKKRPQKTPKQKASKQKANTQKAAKAKAAKAKAAKKKKKPKKKRRDDGPVKPDKSLYTPIPYYALRGADWLYIEWADGHREYYGHATQPYELNNEYNFLEPARQVELAARVQVLKTCAGAGCNGGP